MSPGVLVPIPTLSVEVVRYTRPREPFLVHGVVVVNAVPEEDVVTLPYWSYVIAQFVQELPDSVVVAKVNAPVVLL